MNPVTGRIVFECLRTGKFQGEVPAGFADVEASIKMDGVLDAPVAIPHEITKTPDEEPLTVSMDQADASSGEMT